MYNKILITLVTAMLPSAAMCAKSPKEEEKEPRQEREKEKLIKKSKSKGNKDSESGDEGDIEDERGRSKEELFANSGPQLLRLKKLDKIIKELNNAHEDLHNGRNGSALRVKILLIDEMVKLFEKTRKEFFPDQSEEKIKAALYVPDWSTDHEREEAEAIEKITINPVSVLPNGSLESFFAIKKHFSLD